MSPVVHFVPGHPDRWSGLAFEVPAGLHGAPSLHVEFANWYQFRICDAGRTRLIARVRTGYTGLWWARRDEVGALQLLPHFRAAQARRLGASLRAWAGAFHEALISSPGGLLYPSDWRIEPPPQTDSSLGGYPRPRGLEKCLDESSGFAQWNLSGGGHVYALRRGSPPDAARVKAWRKLVRESCLPPLLLFFVSGMDSYLLVDGHDRLRAALLEGREPPMLVLSSVRTAHWAADEKRQEAIRRNLEAEAHRARSPEAVERMNEVLLDAYGEPSFAQPVTRGWPLAGGIPRWEAEARSLVDVGAPAELLMPR